MRTVAFVFNSILLPPRPSIRAILPFLFLRKQATIEIFNSKDLLGFLDYIVSTEFEQEIIFINWTQYAC